MLSAAAVAICGLAAASGPASAEPPPASAFGRLPVIGQVAISPNGQKVAVSSRDGGQAVVSVATFDEPSLSATRLGDIEIPRLRWLDNQYVIATTTFWDKVFRYHLRVQRLVAITADGQVVSTLLEKDKASANRVTQDYSGREPGPPARVLMVGRAGLSIPKQTTPVLLRVRPADGIGEPIEEGSVRTWNWGFDLAGRPRLRLDQGPHGETVVMTRSAPGAPWTAFWTSSEAETAAGYHGYSAYDDAIMITRKGPNGDQLMLKHLSDGSVSPLGAPHRTAGRRYVWDPHRLRLAGWGFGGERPIMEWLDPEIGEIQTSLAALFKSREVTLIDWSADRMRFVVRIEGPDAPPVWYLFDRKRRELSPLGDEYPELKTARLGETRWLSYKARDGLEIPAYVTLPPGGGRGLPLVVVPHDGPHGLDGYDFDYMTQFLASRGYAVLRAQYRGSWGFEPSFEDAGKGEWGGKVETDLLDGVADLARQGVIDPRRVCIVGEGFGGYLALAGATLHPEAYACAASLSGISNLKLAMSHNGGGAVWGWRQQMLKDFSRDPILDATSPNLHATNVRAPILLMWVDQDVLLPPEQSELMRDSLTAAHKPFEVLVLKDTDHDLGSSQARTKMLETLGAFLAKTLLVSAPQ